MMMMITTNIQRNMIVTSRRFRSPRSIGQQQPLLPSVGVLTAMKRTHSTLPAEEDPAMINRSSWRFWNNAWWRSASSNQRSKSTKNDLHEQQQQPPPSSMDDPVHWSSYEMQRLMDDIRGEMVSTNHPVLATAASVMFGISSTQRIRPMTVFLMARALTDHHEQDQTTTVPTATATASPHLPQQQQHNAARQGSHSPVPSPQELLANVPAADKIRQLANVTEVYHIFMLLHQGVVDEYPQPQKMTAGAPTTGDHPAASPGGKIPFGSKVAILAGDFLLAKALVKKASLGCADTFLALSTALSSITLGQTYNIRQQWDDSHADSHWERHMHKIRHQTASLMALSCQSVAFLLSKENKSATVDSDASLAYAYGHHLGLAFQLMQEVRDYQQHPTRAVEDCVGAGIFTAPLAWAADMSSSTTTTAMSRKDILDAVQETNAVAWVQDQAIQHAQRAVEIVQGLAPSAGRDALVALAQQVVDHPL